MATNPPHITDEEVQCPYVKAHRPLRSHFERHLIKCRQTQKKVELITCPFNQSHKVREPELNWHVSVCSSRSSFEQYKTVFETGVSKRADDIPPATYAEVQASESWDDCAAASYDPSEYASSAPVLRMKIGAPPLERKEFRKAERKRLNNAMQNK